MIRRLPVVVVALLAAVLALAGMLTLQISQARGDSVGVTEGTAGCTTDANGYCTITFAQVLHKAPNVVLITPWIAPTKPQYVLTVSTGSQTTTGVRVRAMKAGAVFANEPVLMSYRAVAAPGPTPPPPTPTPNPNPPPNPSPSPSPSPTLVPTPAPSTSPQPSPSPSDPVPSPVPTPTATPWG